MEGDEGIARVKAWFVMADSSSQAKIFHRLHDSARSVT